MQLQQEVSDAVGRFGRLVAEGKKKWVWVKGKEAAV